MEDGDWYGRIIVCTSTRYKNNKNKISTLKTWEAWKLFPWTTRQDVGSLKTYQNLMHTQLDKNCIVWKLVAWLHNTWQVKTRSTTGQELGSLKTL